VKLQQSVVLVAERRHVYPVCTDHITTQLLFHLAEVLVDV